MKRLNNPEAALAGSILDSYPGNNGASGVAERIIRQMPEHPFYIEGFAGSAVVFRRKRPASHSILVDASPQVCEALRGYTAGMAGVDVVNDSFLDWMASYRWNLTPSTLVYLDPPYLRSTRGCLLYDFEFGSDEQHTLLLELAIKLPCKVMIAGYKSTLYTKLLKKWRTVEIPTMSHAGKRTHILWCNYDPPELLHDSRFVGADYRERENIKRKNKRWAAKFQKMTRPERQAVAAALALVDRPAVEMALRAQAAKP